MALWLAFISSCIVQAQPAAGATTPKRSGTSNPASAVAASASSRPNSAIIPQPNPGFMSRHNNFVETAKRGDVDVLFLGDSITDWWRSSGTPQGPNGVLAFGGKQVFEKYFGSLKVANFGIAGDTTQGVLWRLQHGEGEGYRPKAIMLLIGTNNTVGNSAQETAMGVAAVVFELRKDFPDAKLLLLAIFPRGDRPAAAAKIPEVNKIISALHDGQHVFFMDIGSKFLARDGTIPREIMEDGLHPTNRGYEIWAEAVHDTLLSWLN